MKKYNSSISLRNARILRPITKKINPGGEGGSNICFLLNHASRKKQMFGWQPCDSELGFNPQVQD